FCKIFDELLPGLETVLAEGHTGVITELISGCARHKVRQQEALTGLFEAFHCGEPKSRQITCLPLFLSLQTYEILYPEGHKTASEQVRDYYNNINNNTADIIVNKCLYFPHTLSLSLSHTHSRTLSSLSHTLSSHTHTLTL
uniref:MMS19 nucleotide excision repair protein n=1 Tax=Callorhinchus milii TaxID=7868 RepID=A0A4W3GXJ1_CALMI